MIKKYQKRQKAMAMDRGGSRIFSREGADFQKNFENFVELFLFRLTKLIF